MLESNNYFKNMVKSLNDDNTHTIKHLVMDDGQGGDGHEVVVVADEYVSAMPVDIFKKVVSSQCIVMQSSSQSASQRLSD